MFPIRAASTAQRSSKGKNFSRPPNPFDGGDVQTHHVIRRILTAIGWPALDFQTRFRKTRLTPFRLRKENEGLSE